MGGDTAISPGWGTGSRLATATVVLAGATSVTATLISLVSLWLQLKNYRKPLLQRYVVRILIIVPIFAVASYASIVSRTASDLLDPVRDIYEAFTIYTFFQLLINFLDGERSIIIMTYGRPPVEHAWPLNHMLPKVDISDPYTFLAIKRGILQYTWLKPVLSLATIIMKATNTYQEGYLGLSSGYMWCGLIYNVSMTISLYALAMFWVIMHNDLRPYRPVPKFLCVKLIIFASYWQGFFLAILQWLGAIPNNVAGYTPDNLAAAIQDSLICFEMPVFALMHWYAFSWTDYADPYVSAARLPIKYAVRDAFGCVDLIQDTKETFSGNTYSYHTFEPMGDQMLAHADSHSRVARVLAGMRYERGGRAKYWIPTPGQRQDARTPLLSDSRRHSGVEVDPFETDREDEYLFARARELEFGDWNYPVITASMAPVEAGLGSSGRRRRRSISRKSSSPPNGSPVYDGYFSPHRGNETARRGQRKCSKTSLSHSSSRRTSSSGNRGEGLDLVGARAGDPIRPRSGTNRRHESKRSFHGNNPIHTPASARSRPRESQRRDHPSRLSNVQPPPQPSAPAPVPEPSLPPSRSSQPADYVTIVSPSNTNGSNQVLIGRDDHDNHGHTYSDYNFAAVAEERNVWD